ncbi:uncharacterized protein FOMMEDRAFT_18734 [Fomitiporia mediterranea MF3/22]|uniref:uncharacterized protein n=1 Tax=Fomitiporia mediterranea (strain MF3/22) TaxID=694068 RepID=UPI00044077CC|nr:uncharacterized protein FOMMEDRAFT_18734 [Fomitiporia mediterranea MF3/22]EJD05075.1 hypothetical protein FOMMEDRAFT_18734 [Fomitiporia mediterranea MF3/22]
MLPPPAPVQRSTESSKSWNIPANISSRQLSDRSNGALSQPLKRERSSASLSRKASQDTVHFKRRLGEPISVSSTPKIPVSSLKIRGIPEGSIKDTDHPPHQNDHDEIPVDNAGSSTSSSGDESDTDSDSSHVIVPSHSPLRRSFGIFCTGKGRGAFSGPVQGQRRRSSSRMSTGLRRQRESKEDLMDTSP